MFSTWDTVRCGAKNNHALKKQPSGLLNEISLGRYGEV